MIVRLPGWSWEVRGGGITLVPIEGGGAIRYRERLRPVQSVVAIVRAKTSDPRFVPTTIGPIEHFVTTEGEYAAVVDILGRDPRGMSGSRTLGFVFGDDWYSEIAGVATREDAFARIASTVRAITRDTRLQLGVRRRRYVYRPPNGWYGHQRLPQYASWFPPEYPRDPTSIEIYPALPAPLGTPATLLGDEHHAATERIAMLTIGPPSRADVLAELAPRAVYATSKLQGSAWELSVRDEVGRALARRLVILRDERYLYTAYLDAPVDELTVRRDVFDELLESIEPFPAAGTSTAPISYHWF